MKTIAKRVLTLVAVTAAAAIAAGTAGATGAATPVATVGVTGTSADGTFDGTIAITGVTVVDGRTVAIGTLTGTIAGAGAGVTTVPATPVAVPVQVAQASCTLVSFSFGPLDVDVLGLVSVHVDPIAANVQLNGLLGTLLCGLLGGGGGVTPPVPAAV
jgi:hypothetical protein